MCRKIKDRYPFLILNKILLKKVVIKMKKYFVFGVSFFSLFIFTNATFESELLSNDTLYLDVYYESLCPDSARFINTQLSNAFNSIKSILNIKLVPFGKANVSYLSILFYQLVLIIYIFSLLKLKIQIYGHLCVNMVLMSVMETCFM